MSVVVVGSSNTDLVVRAARIPSPGETVLGDDLLVAPGGKGANQAVAAARLGAEVVLVARVGRDSFGDQAVENFRREGIDTGHVTRDADAPSGVALIVVDEQGENAIAVAPGANLRVSPDDAEAARDRIEKAGTLLLQLEIPLETSRHAARLASAAGVAVILNPAPAADLDDDFLRLVTVLTPNAGEAERLTGVPVRDAASARRAGRLLRKRGPRAVIVTLGGAGALLVSGKGSQLIEAPRVEVVDTTGAGDAFNGAMACVLARGGGWPEAVRYAAAAGALAATRAGAQPSLPDAGEVEELAGTGC